MKKSLLRELYLQSEDITEYTFAMEHFGSMKDWHSYVSKHLEDVTDWRKELELKLKGEAYKVIIQEARGGGKNALQAARVLITKGILTRDGDGSQAASEEEVIDQVKNPTRRVDNDYLRLIVNDAK